MLELKNLHVSVDGTEILKGIDLEVKPGEVLGFLGPNGAGKTTTIRLLLGLLEPSSGEATVLGYDVGRDSQHIREKAGVLLETDGLYTRLSALQNLDYSGRIARLSAVDRKRRIRDLLTAMGLWERRDGRVADFSKGMRQRLMMARTLVNSPDVLFLDEPTDGLDPVSARRIRDLVRAEAARGAGMVFFCNPNNPTATVHGKQAVQDFVDG